MRALAALALVLAVPAASGAAFLLLPSPAEEALPCGADACIALLPGEESVLVHAGSAYAFLGATGRPVEEGTLCGPRLLQVPPGAAMLRVSPGDCEG